MTRCHVFIILGLQFSLASEDFRRKKSGMFGKEFTKLEDFSCRVATLMDIHEGDNIIVASHKEQQGPIHSSLGTDCRNLFMVSTVDEFETFLPELVQKLTEFNRLDVYRKTLNFAVFCEDTEIEDIFDKVSRIDRKYGASSVLRHFSKWLFLLKSDNYSKVPNNTNLDNVATAGLSSFAKPSFDFMHADVSTLLWKPGGRREWSRPPYQNTSSKQGINLFPNIQHGLNLRQLKVGALRWIYFCVKQPSTGSPSYTQVCQDLMDSLSQSLNFSYVFVEPEDRVWGRPLPNSTGTGLLGLVARNEVDFLALPYGMSVERSKVVSFSSLVISLPYQVIYKKVVDDRRNWLILVSCFKWEVYICGLATLVWCAGLFTLLQHGPGGMSKGRDLHWSWEMMKSLGIMILVPLHQSIQRTPVKSSSRVLYTFWWLFCIIIIAVYTGNLVAFIAVKKEKIPFNTLEELAEDNTFGILVRRGSFIEDVIKMSNDTYIHKIWRKVLANRKQHGDIGTSSARELQHHLALLNSGHYVYIDSSVSVEGIDEGQFRKMSRNIQDHRLFLPFPKRSPLRALVSQKLDLLFESDVMSGWMRKWSTKSQNLRAEQHRVQLQFTDLFSAVTACGIAICIAIVILFVEYSLKASKRK